MFRLIREDSLWQVRVLTAKFGTCLIYSLMKSCKLAYS